MSEWKCPECGGLNFHTKECPMRDVQEIILTAYRPLLYDDPASVERLAVALHPAIGCKWQSHAGFVAKTHEEYHRTQAERIIAALREGT